MSKRAVDFDIKPELLVGLGDLVVQFQGLEMQIRSLAQLLVPGPKRFAWMMLCELSFGRLCHFALTLFRELHPETPEFADLKALVNRALALEVERNKVVHSQWIAGARFKMKARNGNGLKFEHEPISPAVLEDLGDRLNACSKDVIDFSEELDLDGIEEAWRARTPSGELASLIFDES